jgi:hypothetical protein
LSFEPRELFDGRGRLKFSLPLGVRHTVNALLGRAKVEIYSPLPRSLNEPVAQTVSAESGEDHQLDVLYVLTRIQMLQQSVEHGSV